MEIISRLSNLVKVSVVTSLLLALSVSSLAADNKDSKNLAFALTEPSTKTLTHLEKEVRNERNAANIESSARTISNQLNLELDLLISKRLEALINKGN